MTLDDLHNIYNHCGWTAAANAIERAEWTTRKERNELYEELERLDQESQEKHRRWTHPSRYPAAFNPHEF
jgi:hypothetical protein